MWLGVLACSAEAPRPSRPPIVLVSLDTLRADRLGCYGSTRGLTPNLDRFAAESVVFDNAWAQSSETLPSHASVFTSRYPSELGSVDYLLRVPADVPTLAGLLRTNGYQTVAITAGGHLGSAFGFETGFDNYLVPEEWGSFRHTLPVAFSWLDTMRGRAPFFLFLHTYDAHSRYLKPTPFGPEAPRASASVGSAAVTVNNGTTLLVDGRYHEDGDLSAVLDIRALRPRSDGERARLAAIPPRPAKGVFAVSQADEALVTATYDGAVRYLDAWFGLFMAELNDRELLDEVVIVVFADHGEELGERGLFNHRFSLSEQVLRVPLLVRLPGAVAGGRHEGAQVALLDLLPTLVEAAGGTAPPTARGHSLWGGMGRGEVPEHAFVYAEGVFRMVSARAAGRQLTFSGLAADSPFLEPLLAVSPVERPAFETTGSFAAGDAERYRAAMLQWRRSLTVGPRADGLDERRKAVLRERGYW